MPYVREYSHATYELVCDEVHVHPSVLDLTINSLGTQRLCLISDAMSLAGMGAGEGLYLGKQIYSNGKACYYRDNDILIGSAMLISESAKFFSQKLPVQAILLSGSFRESLTGAFANRSR